MGPDRTRVLPMFHAMTGCDTVSFFGGRGKKTAWDIWITNAEHTDVFQQLTTSPNEVSNSYLYAHIGVQQISLVELHAM